MLLHMLMLHKLMLLMQPSWTSKVVEVEAVASWTFKVEAEAEVASWTSKVEAEAEVASWTFKVEVEAEVASNNSTLPIQSISKISEEVVEVEEESDYFYLFKNIQ